MAASRSTLPSPVLEAIEGCIKAAALSGEAGAGASMRRNTVRDLELARQALVLAIEEHATAMYEGGIELGLAQAGASAR